MENKIILASSCLLGLCVNYRGSCHPHPDLIRLAEQGHVVCFCPEQGGGMPTPRIPSEIEHGMNSSQVLAGQAHVVNKEGHDVTAYYINGAKLIAELANRIRPSLVVMREGSPSCGVNLIHDGTFTGTKIPGCGVSACALKQLGYRIVSDTQFACSNPDELF
ncbi:MAG: DUF523 domain-containing protein [Candidatus Sumerlaeales bacterium]|nr:DUF523 domain-containing protein [Candidatus Sumerlaeales bacterium]